MFRTKWPLRVNEKFRTEIYSSQVVQKLDFEIDSSNIEDCRWLLIKEPKRFIVKFSKQKYAITIRKVKKNLKSMDLSSRGVTSPGYTNVSLCKCYKMLWQNWKKLCVNKFINSFWVLNRTIRLKLSNNERSCIITNINDLEELLLGN